MEAASCGLLVVSTRVGGIPEVLPSDMIILADPHTSSLTAAIEKAIRKIKNNETDPIKFHNRVKAMYSWDDVAIRTERVYDNVMDMIDVGISERFALYYTNGDWAGKLSVMILALNYIIFSILEMIWPADRIERVYKRPIRESQKSSSEDLVWGGQ